MPAHVRHYLLVAAYFFTSALKKTNMQSPADQGDSQIPEEDDEAFRRVNSILTKLKKQKYQSNFKDNEISDDVLDCIKTEEKMCDILKKDAKIPVGVAIHFSHNWFRANSSDTEIQNKPPKGEGAVVNTAESLKLDDAQTSCKLRVDNKEVSRMLEKTGKESIPDKHGTASDNKSKTGIADASREVVGIPSKDINENLVSRSNANESPLNSNTKTSESNRHDYASEKLPSLSRSRVESTASTLSTAGQHQAGVNVQPEKISTTEKGDCLSEHKKSTCTRRAFGTLVGSFHYSKGDIFVDEENRQIEYKALTNETPQKLPWKIMEKARLFICGILNAGTHGTIYFGVGDSYDAANNFTRGEIVGLEVEALKDEINKAFQNTLNDHIKSDDGKMKRGGDMNCVQIHFVPVKECGEATGRYVIEIEIKRDWKFCKDHVYYFQQWTKQRGITTKSGLHDLYKVNKDKWEDPTIRTCGPTATVKNIDTEKQIKEPLSQKYKDWQDEVNRKQFRRLPSYDSAEVDVNKLNNDISESLREINFKEKSYILIANKVPPEYRGSDGLAFLQSIPWLAVFDLFDPNTKKDGLHFICNETSDSARATVKELGDFKDLKTTEDMSTRDTTWILRSQSMHEGNWTKNSKDSLYRALSAFNERSPTGRIHCVFLGLSDENLQEMADIIDSCFSIIGNNASKCISIICEKTDVGNGISKNLKADVRKDVKPPCSIFGFPLELLRENIKRMLGPVHFEEPGATTNIPYMNGKRAVLNKRLNALTDLEIYFPEPKIVNSLTQIEKARESFYMGDDIKQLNLFHNHDIERTRAADLTRRIEKSLKQLSNPSEQLTPHYVETVTLSYESGSGATTLCRRILWDMRKSYRCAVVKAITTDTDYQIDELQKLLYETSPQFIPPILLLVDNFPEYQVRHLQDKTSERKTKCVLVNTIPKAKFAKEERGDVPELAQLDSTEIERVKRILVDVKDIDDGLREAAAKKVKREKRFIWLGLELFGRDYIDIRPRLSKHIRDIIDHNLTDELKDAYEMILRFCCLLDFYSKGRSIYPHTCAVDILYARGELDEDGPNHIDKIHDKFGGLLLEDVSESEGYRGWRPAHFLVGEVVRKEMETELLVTAKKLVMEMNEGPSYAKKFLISNTVNVFLQREKKSEGPPENPSQYDFFSPSSFEHDMSGSLQVQTRFSALITDIMSLNPGESLVVTNALDLLVTLNENVTMTQQKARTWQQIARVFAYEIGIKEIPPEAKPLVERINQLVCPGRATKDSPTNGFDIAHLVIDEAIKLQESHVHHLVTKGAFFMIKLRDLREEAKRVVNATEELKVFIQEAINTSKKGIEVYDAALKKTPDDYYHAMVGKIHTVIILLEILKNLPFFAHHNEGPDESFKKYMTFGIHPADLQATLSQEDLDYFICLKSIVVQLSNDFFREIKLCRSQSYKVHEVQELTNAKIRAQQLRKKFYHVTGLDRTPLANETGYKEDIVHDLLYKHEETPYSSWQKLPLETVAQFYKSLKEAIPKETVSRDGMLVCARAALQQNVSVDELSSHVERWCQKFPRSVWAHLFNYMIHFPAPSGTLKANVPMVKSSIEVCKSNTPHSRHGYRKSAAEYLLGKGVGLNSIIPSNEVSKDSQQDKTNFWRNRDVFEKLERLRGQKILDRKGVLMYKGIEIIFDNERYPKESRDDLWFCLGFTVNGPYAYDPIPKDVYDEIEKKFREQKNSSSQNSPSLRDQWRRTKSSVEGRAKKILELGEPSAWKSKSVGSVTSQAIPSSQVTAMEKTKAKTIKQYTPDQSPATHYDSPGSKRQGKGRKEESNWKSNPALIIRRRANEGHQKTFEPKRIDKEGRVHHGAYVPRAAKSSECRTHPQGHAPDTCSFAHSWKGDHAVQTVCLRCTKDQKRSCTESNEHQRFIYNLGPYFDETGKTWMPQTDH